MRAISLPCRWCDGAGEVEAIAGHGGYNSAGYPIPAYRMDECDACEGTGDAHCDLCHHRPAVVETKEGDLCAECAALAAEEVVS